MSRALGVWATLVALAALPAAAQQDYSKVEVRTLQVAPSVYMITGAGGNIGLSVGDDAVFVIDDQFAELSERIRAAITAVSPKPVRFVLNTHWHFDHVGGNENFGKAGALIVAHDNVRRRMSSEQFIESLRMKVPPSPAVALPVVTFAGAVTFHLNGEEIRAIHVPDAHTDGDAIVHFVRSDVVHMGDVYFNGFYPFIDTSSGGSVDGVVAAADKILAMITDKTKVIPGHGPLSNKSELKAYRDMLATVAGRVRQKLRDGGKIEEITADASITADFDPKWGSGFIPPNKFREMVAMNLIKRAP